MILRAEFKSNKWFWEHLNKAFFENNTMAIFLQHWALSCTMFFFNRCLIGILRMLQGYCYLILSWNKTGCFRGSGGDLPGSLCSYPGKRRACFFIQGVPKKVRLSYCLEYWQPSIGFSNCFYGSATNHLEIGIRVGKSVTTQISTQALCLNDQAYNCLNHFLSCIIVISCIMPKGRRP